MKNQTIVISCAGIGSRLGAGKPKALVEVAGKSMLERQLELLKEYDDIRIVVGYQAEKVIELAKSLRPDVTICYNNDYLTTRTGASFSKGFEGAREYVVGMDGDLLVHPDDLKAFLEYEGELIGGCTPNTDGPVLMTLDDTHSVVKFSREEGELEWTGLSKTKTARMVPGDDHVYHLLEPLMPIKVMKIRTREIDTPNDFERAVQWIESNYQD